MILLIHFGSDKLEPGTKKRSLSSEMPMWFNESYNVCVRVYVLAIVCRTFSAKASVSAHMVHQDYVRSPLLLY